MRSLAVLAVAGMVAACSTRVERERDAYIEADATCQQSGYAHGSAEYDGCMQYMWVEFQANEEWRQRMGAALAGTGDELIRSGMSGNQPSGGSQSSYRSTSYSCSQSGIYMNCSGLGSDGAVTSTSCSRMGNSINCTSY
jgi:hypothetical protein